MQCLSIEEFQDNTDEFPAFEAYPRKKGGHTDGVTTRGRGRHRGEQQATTKEVRRWAHTSFRVSSSEPGGKHVSGQLKVPTKRMSTRRAAEAFIQQTGYSKVWNVEDGRIGSWPLLRVQFPVDNTPNEWLLVKTVRQSYIGSVKDGPRSTAEQATFIEKSATLCSLPERRLQRRRRKEKRQPLGTSGSEQGTVKDAIKEDEQRKKGRQDCAVSHTYSPIQKKMADTASELLTKDNQRQIHGRTTGWPLVSGGGLKAGTPDDVGKDEGFDFAQRPLGWAEVEMRTICQRPLPLAQPRRPDMEFHDQTVNAAKHEGGPETESTSVCKDPYRRSDAQLDAIKEIRRDQWSFGGGVFECLNENRKGFYLTIEKQFAGKTMGIVLEETREAKRTRTCSRTFFEMAYEDLTLKGGQRYRQALPNETLTGMNMILRDDN